MSVMPSARSIPASIAIQVVCNFVCNFVCNLFFNVVFAMVLSKQAGGYRIDGLIGSKKVEKGYLQTFVCNLELWGCAASDSLGIVAWHVSCVSVS